MQPGLPDGIFSNQKTKFLDGLAMEDVDIFYGHLVFLQPMGIIYVHFVIFCSNLVYFSSFWYVVPTTIRQP
jgi:hypothetical protein